jgi:hypothetical protein
MSIFLQPEIVERKKLGVFDHPGLRVMNGNRVEVIHNSFEKGKVIISDYDEYAEGHEVIASGRYRPSIPGYQMEANARRLIGTSWRPWYNCQHFISEVAGEEPRSYQLEWFLGSFALFALIAAIKR